MIAWQWPAINVALLAVLDTHFAMLLQCYTLTRAIFVFFFLLIRRWSMLTQMMTLSDTCPLLSGLCQRDDCSAAAPNQSNHGNVILCWDWGWRSTFLRVTQPFSQPAHVTQRTTSISSRLGVIIIVLFTLHIRPVYECKKKRTPNTFQHNPRTTNWQKQMQIAFHAYQISLLK